MIRLALVAMVVVLAGACAGDGGDAAVQDTLTPPPVVAPTPDTTDTLGRDTTDTLRRDTTTP